MRYAIEQNRHTLDLGTNNLRKINIRIEESIQRNEINGIRKRLRKIETQRLLISFSNIAVLLLVEISHSPIRFVLPSPKLF
jgi:hypothetical protein